MIAYKGFNSDLTCTLGQGRYQYEVGKTFREPKSKCINSGLHCAEYPPDVFSYYPIGCGNRYFLVEAGGHIDEDALDSKVACTEMTLLRELSIREMLHETVAYIFEHPQRALMHNGGGVMVAENEATLLTDGGFCIAIGEDPRVRSKVDSGYMVLITREGQRIVGAKMLQVGRAGVNTDTWYTNRKEWICGADTCVACGEPIPEGRQVCPNCEAKHEKENDRKPADTKGRRRKAV